VTSGGVAGVGIVVEDAVEDGAYPGEPLG